MVSGCGFWTFLITAIIFVIGFFAGVAIAISFLKTHHEEINFKNTV
ncbi:hypothetical protein [Metamycoplasma alkalescens]|nr:hypothetical protein [Metamycoplasma alkalescens]